MTSVRLWAQVCIPLIAGSFGRVRLAQHKTTGQFIALKILKKAEILKLKQADHVQSEVNILNTIDHPFLIKMHGVSQDDKYLILYLDYIPGGELFNYLRSIGNLNNEEAKFYAGQVALMFEYLHSKDIIYR